MIEKIATTVGVAYLLLLVGVAIACLFVKPTLFMSAVFISALVVAVVAVLAGLAFMLYDVWSN